MDESPACFGSRKQFRPDHDVLDESYLRREHKAVGSFKVPPASEVATTLNIFLLLVYSIVYFLYMQ